MWDFGSRYGTSQEKNPQLTVPLEGDTFTAILQTGYNNCYDTKEFEIQVPAIQGEAFGKDTAYICEGESVVFNNKTYDRHGDYTDTLSTVYGCDSIISLHLKVLVADSIVADTTICSNEALDFSARSATPPAHISTACQARWAATPFTTKCTLWCSMPSKPL